MVHIKAIRALLGLLDLCKVCSVVAKEVIQVGYIKPLGRYALKLSSLDGLIPQLSLLVKHIHRGCMIACNVDYPTTIVLYTFWSTTTKYVPNKRGVPNQAQTQIEVFTHYSLSHVGEGIQIRS